MNISLSASAEAKLRSLSVDMLVGGKHELWPVFAGRLDTIRTIELGELVLFVPRYESATHIEVREFALAANGVLFFRLRAWDDAFWFDDEIVGVAQRLEGHVYATTIFHDLYGEDFRGREKRLEEARLSRG